MAVEQKREPESLYREEGGISEGMGMYSTKEEITSAGELSGIRRGQGEQGNQENWGKYGENNVKKKSGKTGKFFKCALRRIGKN